MKERPTACVLPMPMAAPNDMIQNMVLVVARQPVTTTAIHRISVSTMVRLGPIQSAR